MGSQHPKIEALHTQRVSENRLIDFRVGDTIKVHYKVVEGDKERIQVFQGQVIRQRRNGVGATFTVRKVSYSVGVERIFPDHSPNIEKVEVLQRGKVHQARLFYLRDLSGKAARIKEREGSYQAAAQPEGASAEGAAGEGAAEGGEAKARGRGKHKKKT